MVTTSISTVSGVQARVQVYRRAFPVSGPFRLMQYLENPVNLSVAESTASQFGYSVSLGYDEIDETYRVAVGMPSGAGFNVSRAFVWVLDVAADKFVLEQAFPGGFALGSFGKEVAISGRQLAIGAPDEAHVSTFSFDSGVVWTSSGEITSPVPGNDSFGAALSFSFDQAYLAVGAPMHDGTELEEGAVYVFQAGASAPRWGPTPLTTIANNRPSPNGHLGAFRALAFDTQGTYDLAIGASGNVEPIQDANSGLAYVYSLQGAGFGLYVELIPSLKETSSEFGCSVALDSPALVVGHCRITAEGAVTYPENGAAWYFDKRRTNAAGVGYDDTQYLPGFCFSTSQHFGTATAAFKGAIAIGAPNGLSFCQVDPPGPQKLGTILVMQNPDVRSIFYGSTDNPASALGSIF